MTVSAPVTGQLADVDGFRHEFHTVNGCAIHAVAGGAGPAVVLIRGWPFTWRAWRPVLAPLAALGYTVIAPVLRGTGHSGKPDGGYSKANVAQDLVEFTARLGFDRAHVVGMDLGTMVA